MLTPTRRNALKEHIKLFLGALILGILFSCAKTPQQIIENPSEFHRHRDSIVRVESKFGFFKVNGSGFFVERNKVATNIHVISLSGPVYVTSVDKETTWKVKGVAAYDVKNDLAILKVVGEGEVLPLGNSDVIRGGEPISAVGYPDEKYKVAEGTLHSIRDSDKWLRMNVDTNSGGSGGPVLNGKGQVVGIFASSDGYYSYAIPSNILKVLLMQPASTEPLEQWHKREFISSYAHYVKGKMNYGVKRYEKTIANLDETIRLNPEFIFAYYTRGLTKENLGNYKGAISDYDKVIRLNPEFATAYINRGLAKDNLGEYKGAINDYNKAIKLNPEFIAAYINRGLAKDNLGEYKGAINDYNKAIKLNPQIAGTYHNRAYAKFKLGDHRGAINDLNKTIKLNPQDSTAYDYRGIVKFELGDHKDALEDFNKAIKLNPQHATAYYNRGAAKQKLGDYKGAISDYDKVIKLNPEDAAAYYIRAHAKEALGQHDAAKADFEKAKELDADIVK